MYQRYGKQRNKTNLFLVSFFLSRSSLKPLSKASQSVGSENLKCAIWSQYAKSRERKKIKISKQPRAEDIQKASGYFKDEVYTRISDLNTRSIMFAADL